MGITSCVLSDHSEVKLGSNSRKNYRKYTNRLDNTLANDKEAAEEIKMEVKKILKLDENETIRQFSGKFIALFASKIKNPNSQLNDTSTNLNQNQLMGENH